MAAVSATLACNIPIFHWVASSPTGPVIFSPWRENRKHDARSRVGSSRPPEAQDGAVGAIAESARGVSPRAAHRSGRDSLASSGSCHRTKAAAFRREMGLFLLPVGPLPTSVTCPLRSTGITPLPRYYGAVRPCPPHRYFRPRGFAACTFSLGIVGQVLKFRTRARMRVMPPIHRTPRGQ